MKIGIISDTHGYLDPRVYDAFAGVHTIIHAGDICSPSVLWELETIAPVYAVLGNCDHSVYGPAIGAAATPTIGGRRFKIVHRPKDMGNVSSDIAVVVCGHTHRSLIEVHDTYLFINPGSATNPRSGNDPTVALLDIAHDGTLNARVVPL
jgi:uncharacterized protein